MMIKPGITELDRCVDSRYTLVTMVAKRARMIGTERKAEEEECAAEGTVAVYDEKPVTQAVNEIADGVVGYVRSGAVEKAKEYEEEKLEAVMQLEKGLTEIVSEQPDNLGTEESGEPGFLDSVLAAADAENELRGTEDVWETEPEDTDPLSDTDF